ncbi:MAG: sigma-54 dependent transcriptional regulator [Bryobacteraceae bacterium]|nr:sigma-54-dependent Fis family transcriptional regulator [Solibacteraceae bacterium]MCO5350395.1 sigma-54 dependent transcriptional regulator [Bryobacteraceae bacterium]
MPDSDTVRTPRGRILVIDDEADIRESLEALLDLEGYQVATADGGVAGLDRFERGVFDLVLLDLMMPDRSGLEVLDDIRKRDRDTPVFLITAYGSIEVAVEALKSGANDYFSKPWDNEKLIIEIDRQIARSRLEHENRELRRALKQRYSFPNIVGKSERMLRVLDLVGQVAASKSNILITGETGTGKELIAKAIHAASPRAERPFVGVNSGSVPPDLLESALFGHVKGAFTGAVANRKGYFETADHGTLFLDEIGMLSADMQVKLLRVLQEREFMPVGSNDIVRVDVRILAATNAELKKLVDEGKFREDLYYRLNVINLQLPPLRDRKEDIPALIDHFFQIYCRENEKFMDGHGRSRLHFEPEALHILMDYSWPGNVRELENAIERAVVLATQEEVPASVLPEPVLHSAGVRIPREPGEQLPADASLFEVVADFERQTIIDVLDQVNYSQTEAAARLKIPLSTLNQKIKRLDISIRKKSEKSA